MTDTIAYLAPEIPSLSATFVYNEILTLESKGIRITPISVHYPGVVAKEEKARKLLERSIFLYSRKSGVLLRDNLLLLLTRPDRYCKALLTVLRDVLKVGVFQAAAVKLLYQFWQAGSVAQIIRRNGCQHLHIHFAHVPTQIGMYAAMMSNVQFTFTAHANDLFERGLLLKEKVRRSQAAVMISQYNCNFLVEQGADSEKLKIVRCGVDTQEYEFSPPQVSRQPVVIGSLARLVEKKGMDTLILAAHQLDQQGIDFRLEICGDGPLMEPLQALVSQHNLGSKIKFVGAIAHDQVFAWLRGLDVFVLACQRDAKGDQDGIPVVLMEAMAVGVPVVSTQISGIPELIENGVSGFLAAPGSPAALAEAIGKLMSEPKALAQITQAARDRIVNEFDSRLNADRLFAIFH